MDVMKDNYLVSGIGILLALIITIIISQVMLEDITMKQRELESRIIMLEDSLRVQHNHYHFSITKDTTIINQTIQLKCTN